LNVSFNFQIVNCKPMFLKFDWYYHCCYLAIITTVLYIIDEERGIHFCECDVRS
jgi:hypothetical protein